ncbi:Hypothetical protein PMT_2735 [Prochlorococcus marinus str. MIT 9313]|uniref:Uncharacterized protein n=1 Tax=Prochlorococcus marinus (strain MIT 9313) TaxID=74547 RepID=B9ESB6_PROMM|nr:Hypothetical protein PMT_2735 [Prochlorococcus marinus str. MIT 9313]
MFTDKALIFYSISLGLELSISPCQLNKKQARSHWKAIEATQQSTATDEPPNWFIFSCASVLE